MMNYMPAEQPTPDAPVGQDTEQDTDVLRKYLEQVNIAEDLNEKVLEDISKQVSDGFEYDLRSREDWEKNLKEWIDLALQVKERKTTPWQDASNVKYPLLSTAAMQFNARAYPSLVPATGDVVKAVVIGKDTQQLKLEQAKRVGKFMSYQLLHEMDGWEEDMDKLLIMLPIVGTLFKKTYYNDVLKQNVSELIMPLDIVVNNWAKTLEGAERVSQIILLNRRQVKERQMSKRYLDVDLGDPQLRSDSKQETVQDATLPYEIIEQHTFYDLDGDGYAEPYIVVFERASKKILRIAARFDDSSLILDDDGKLQQIIPTQYFTKFSFISNPNGSFYDIGFGLLLTPLNESVNTLINQLIDSGTLNNLQGGFLGKGLKLKMGGMDWKPGEWKTIQSNSDDLRKQILPLPTKEPSKVLFELMGTLITSGKELASVAEIFVGKMPGQNTPATTTMATIEQGMKVFTAVYKRIYRSLQSEYKKLFNLNRIYLDINKYSTVLDAEVSKEDFDEKSYNICPTADPSTPTQTEKLMKAQGLLELLPLGILDPVAVITRVLDAQEQPNIEQLFNQQVKETGQFQPPPDPKLQEMEMKGQLEAKKIQMQGQALERKAALEQSSEMAKLAMKKQESDMKIQAEAQKAKLDGAIAVHKQRIFSVTEQAKVNQTMAQKDMQHRQSMEQAKEKNKLAKSNSSGNGKTTRSPSK